jgi:hypothetical protein
MRDNGFLSAAHALAELIDNSIQADADRVELITFEERRDATSGGRAVKNISKIGVLDNGKGMSPEVLHLALEFGASKNRDDASGIGKFGMGLPNSSISQCKRVDVWSWVEPEKYMYTYLDIDEIKGGDLETIPDPARTEMPSDVRAALGDTLPSSGTFVLWSKIDRCQWKTGKSIFRHTQDVVGRMYRNFLGEDQVAIVFKSAELRDSLFIVEDEQRFLPNDPMYLVKNTSLPSLPEEFDGESMFEYVEDGVYPFEIPDENGIARTVTIKGTVLKRSVLSKLRASTRQNVGATPWGKHAAKNVGLSIVRAGRELSLAPEFILPTGGAKERGRWYGIEISFDPSLDNIFGVTNNKQHVVNLRMMRASEDYEREGFDSENEYRSDLLANNDPKLRIYEVVNHIREMERRCLNRIDSYNFKGTKGDSGDFDGGKTQIDGATSEINKKNMQREEVFPTERSTITQKELEEELKLKGADNPEEKAKAIVEHQLQVWVEELPMSTSAFFDVSTKKGFTLLQINTNHVFSQQVLEKVPESQRDAIEICLAGWARMERECTSEKRLQQLQMARRDWGQLLDDYLSDD